MIGLAPAPNDGDRVRVEGSGEDAAGAANARLRVRPAPPREPPFDDERPRHLSLVGPHDRPLPFGAAAATDRSPAAGLTLHSVSTGLPDVAAFSRRFVIGVIETATGRRAPGQLARHTSPAVHAGLCQSAGRGTRLGTARRPATLHSIHVTEPLECVAEVAAVVRVGNRFRALALRLEGTDGRWRCVRLQVG